MKTELIKTKAEADSSLSLAHRLEGLSKDCSRRGSLKKRISCPFRVKARERDRERWSV